MTLYAAQRRLRDRTKLTLRFVFELGQKIGLDILPRHYYSEIPNISKLRRTRSWRELISLASVRGIAPEEQAAFLRDCLNSFTSAYSSASDVYKLACRANGMPGYGEIEAHVLYAFIRKHRPPRILQIGCGISTAVCLMAAVDAPYRLEMICIDPYPSKFLRERARQGEIKLVVHPVEEAQIDLPSLLRPGDLLFIDSTHTLGPAGEVTRLIVNVLPMLPDGAWVHFHDINLPYDYSPDTLSGALAFQHETALLLAFLSLNWRYRVALSLSLLHYQAPEELGRLFVNYSPAPREDGLSISGGHCPTSIYLVVDPSAAGVSL